LSSQECIAVRRHLCRSTCGRASSRPNDFGNEPRCGERESRREFTARANPQELASNVATTLSRSKAALEAARLDS
jgi:hypothetical protein